MVVQIVNSRYCVKLIVAFIAGVMSFFIVHAQEQPKLWEKGKPLQWSDFQATPDQNSSSLANSFTAIVFKFNMQFKNGKRVFVFDVWNQFSPSRSWSKIEKQTPQLLKQQQLYFDISEYFSRKLKKDFKKFNFTNNYQNEVGQLYEENAKQRKAMQSHFYLATAFADDDSLTDKWLSYVNELLVNEPSLDQAIQKEPVADLQNTEKHKLWNTAEPLTWADFKGPVDSNSAFWAMTYTRCVFTAHVDESNGVYKLTFKVAGAESPLQSWTKPALQSDGLLRHEQMHFNIAEFFARQLLKQLNGYVYTSNYSREVFNIYNQNNMQLKAMQAMYDEQTEHRKNGKMQTAWEKYIADLLNNDYNFDEAQRKMPVST